MPIPASLPTTVVNVAKPDPVVVNVPRPAPPAKYDVVPVRDEDGNVTRYKQVERP